MRAVFLSLSMFCLNLVFGQNIEEIKLNVNIQDPMKSTKNLNLLDLRENKEVGQIKKFSSGKESKVVFQKEERQAVKEWFEKYNETRGKDELYLVLKKLNISQEDTRNKLEVSAGVFAKKADKFHYISKVDTVLFEQGNSNALVRAIPALLGNVIKKSYKIVPWKEELSQENLANYEEVMKQNMPAFAETTLKDGVYKSYHSFFRQMPEEGHFTIVKNEKGEVLRAVNEDNKTRIPARQINIYVADGKAYKNTLAGFVEMEKDNRGYYIMSNHASLFPLKTSPTYGIMFGLAGGLIGGLIGGTIDAARDNNKTKKEQAKEKSKYYIDHLTGYYMLEE